MMVIYLMRRGGTPRRVTDHDAAHYRSGLVAENLSEGSPDDAVRLARGVLRIYVGLAPDTVMTPPGSLPGEYQMEIS